MNPKLLPNLLSGTRIALVPVVVASGIMGSRFWFVVLVVLSLSTDALDGFFARRFNAFSDLGRKLDSIADYCTMIAGLTGIALLWPDIMRRELPWVVSGVGAFVAVIVYGFVRLGRAPCYHTWASKLGVVGCAFAQIPLLTEWSPIPFRVMVVVMIFAALEEMIITVLLPSHVGEMATVWHALRLRRQRRRFRMNRAPAATAEAANQ